MAFFGRMNSRGSFVDCDMIGSNRFKLRTSVPNQDEDEHCPRTYIKLYESEQQEYDPSRLRYVNHSASSCELISMADTEVSTLRSVSPRSLETETSTLTPGSSSSITDNSSISEGSGDAVESDKSQQQQLERGSTTSMCSWEEDGEEEPDTAMDNQPNETDAQSSCFTMPLLELDSNTTSVYYEQQAQLEQLKQMRRSNEAYDNWLSGKKRQFQYKQQAELKQRQLKQQNDELRQQLNEQRVQEWCVRKARQSTNTSTHKPNISKARSPGQLDEVALRRLQCWEMRKIQQAEQRLQRQQRESQRRQQQQEQRKQQATQAWQHWMKGVAQRPKPVPLNQGIETLRGTVSNIYVNPNQWINIKKLNK